MNPVALIAPYQEMAEIARKVSKKFEKPIVIGESFHNFCFFQQYGDLSNNYVKKQKSLTRRTPNGSMNFKKFMLQR